MYVHLRGAVFIEQFINIRVIYVNYFLLKIWLLCHCLKLKTLQQLQQQEWQRQKIEFPWPWKLTRIRIQRMHNGILSPHKQKPTGAHAHPRICLHSHTHTHTVWAVCEIASTGLCLAPGEFCLRERRNQALSPRERERVIDERERVREGARESIELQRHNNWTELMMAGGCFGDVAVYAASARACVCACVCDLEKQ